MYDLLSEILTLVSDTSEKKTVEESSTDLSRGESEVSDTPEKKTVEDLTDKTREESEVSETETSSYEKASDVSDTGPSLLRREEKETPDQDTTEEHALNVCEQLEEKYESLTSDTTAGHMDIQTEELKEPTAVDMNEQGLEKKTQEISQSSETEEEINVTPSVECHQEADKVEVVGDAAVLEKNLSLDSSEIPQTEPQSDSEYEEYAEDVPTEAAASETHLAVETVDLADQQVSDSDTEYEEYASEEEMLTESTSTDVQPTMLEQELSPSEVYEDEPGDASPASDEAAAEMKTEEHTEHGRDLLQSDIEPVVCLTSDDSEFSKAGGCNH
ncbi:nucleolin 2-like [Haliotis rubra]|uniref:nucleolin 2-like n=1 Tax=Haliotis rubra TaxID=36100 RepID=UPI001EE5C0DD|nr:nucleolin 2-like [Haliotis rubra]